MDSALVTSTTNYAISTFKTFLGDNLYIVLGFAVGVLVWVIVKKWFFGGARRI